MSGIISVEPYHPAWPAIYNQEAERWKSALCDLLLDIQHIGSTAVPGLAAKPIVDILLVVTSLQELDACDAAIKAMGYMPRGEYGISGRRYFIKGGDRRTHHVHAFANGSQHIVRHLAFRDYLRRHPDLAEQYAAIKRKAVAACGGSSAIYSQLKNDFICCHEKLALEELSLKLT